MSPEVDARRRWAYARIRPAASPPPRYGTAEWLALDDGEPVKLAGLIVAAEAWATGEDNLEADLCQEVELSRRVFKAAEDAEYQQRVAAHREHWGTVAKRRIRYHLPPFEQASSGGDAS